MILTMRSRAGILREEDIPLEFRKVLGYSARERLNTLIHDVIRNSCDTNDIAMSPHMEETMQKLRAFMFDNVYYDPIAKREEGRAMGLIQSLYEYYEKHIGPMPEEYIDLIEKKRRAQRTGSL